MPKVETTSDIKYTMDGMRLMRCREFYEGYTVTRLVLGAGGKGAFVESWYRERRQNYSLGLAGPSWSGHLLSNGDLEIKISDNCGTTVVVPCGAVPTTQLSGEEVFRLENMRK